MHNFYLSEQLKHHFFTSSSFRLKALTTESSVVISALQKSKTGLLEISEDKTKIRRSPDKPLPEQNDEYKDAVKHRSVYIVSFIHICLLYSRYWCHLLQINHFFIHIYKKTTIYFNSLLSMLLIQRVPTFCYCSCISADLKSAYHVLNLQ